MNLFKNKNLFCTFIVVFLVLQCQELTATSSTDGATHDWRDVAEALEALKETLVHQSTEEQNVTRFTNDGADVFADMLEEKRQLLSGELNEGFSVLRYLKNVVSDLTNLNQTLTVPPKKKPIEGCSYPFKQYEVGCLWFHRLPSENHVNARRRCQALGTDLMVVPASKLSKLKSVLFDIHGRGVHYIWIGATKVGESWSPMSWRWVDGSKFDLTSSDMHLPQYDNRGPCLMLSSYRGYRAMPWDCEDKLGYICEMKI